MQRQSRSRQTISASAQHSGSRLKQRKLIFISVVHRACSWRSDACQLFLRGGSKEGVIDSIAVLPFENRSADPIPIIFVTGWLNHSFIDCLSYRTESEPPVLPSATKENRRTQ